MNRTIVDVHVLQTVPPSNLNRDDNGTPKSATYGGVPRARVSSQAWKRATRQDFRSTLETSDLGVRTKRVVELVAARIELIRPSSTMEDAQAMAVDVLSGAGITVKEPRGKKGAVPEATYLLFLSELQIDALARVGARCLDSGDKVDKKEAQQFVKDKNSIDLALFGRMVADVSDLNVDAACQVAHALSTHAVANEFDYFTAVDDHKETGPDADAGAGMIGTVEFNSSTLYRYATIDVDQLFKNLGDGEATVRAVSTFLTSFVRSMPTGKQNTFANRTLPDAIVVSVREDQPISLVGAFEEPVKNSLDGGRVAVSVRRLVEHATDVAAAFDAEPVRTWVVGVGASGIGLESLGERVSFGDLVSGASDLVAQRLDLVAEAVPA